MFSLFWAKLFILCVPNLFIFNKFKNVDLTTLLENSNLEETEFNKKGKASNF